MLEFDFIYLAIVVSIAIVCWLIVTQIWIPIAKNLPLFPAFKTEGQRLSDEMEHFRRDQLVKEIERARLDKTEAELEAELFETRKSAEQKRQEVIKKQETK